MKRRCTHPSWEVLATRFKEPPPNLRSMQGGSEDVTLAILYGLSTVTQRCTACGWVQVESMPGRAIVPDHLMVKVTA